MSGRIVAEVTLEQVNHWISDLEKLQARRELTALEGEMLEDYYRARRKFECRYDLTLACCDDGVQTLDDI